MIYNKLMNEAIYCKLNGLPIWDTPWANYITLSESFIEELTDIYKCLGIEIPVSAEKIQDLIPQETQDNFFWVPLCHEIATKLEKSTAPLDKNSNL